MNNKYIGASIVVCLSAVAGYMIFTDEQNKQLFAPVSPEVQPVKQSIFTTEAEMVNEFGENPYRASERYKNATLRVDGVVSYIHPSGNRMLFARSKNNQRYEVAILGNPDTIKYLSTGNAVIVYGEYTEIYDNKIIVIKSEKITPRRY